MASKDRLAQIGTIGLVVGLTLFGRDNQNNVKAKNLADSPWCTAAQDCPWLIGDNPSCTGSGLVSCTQQPDQYTRADQTQRNSSAKESNENPGDYEYIMQVLQGAPVVYIEGAQKGRNPRFIDDFIHTKAYRDQWNGYFTEEQMRNGASSFGDSGYPYEGQWGPTYKLFINQTEYKLVAFWVPNDSNKRILTFAFYDLESNSDQNGNHNGQHHFEWGRVDRESYRVRILGLKKNKH